MTDVATQVVTEAQPPAPATTVQPETQAATPQGEQQVNTPAQAVYSQADVEQIIRDRLKRQEQKFAADAARERETAERKAAEEQGKFRELYEKAQADLVAKETERKGLELAALKREAADKTQLPISFADRLRGETLDDLIADAKTLLAAMPKPAAPNINSSGGNGATGSIWSEEEKARLASVFGVSAKNFGKAP